MRPPGLALGLGETGHHLLQGDVLAEARPGGEALSALGATERLSHSCLVVPEALEAGPAEVVPAGGSDRAAEHLQANGAEDLALQCGEIVVIHQELALGRS